MLSQIILKSCPLCVFISYFIMDRVSKVAQANLTTGSLAKLAWGGLWWLLLCTLVHSQGCTSNLLQHSAAGVCTGCKCACKACYGANVAAGCSHDRLHHRQWWWLPQQWECLHDCLQVHCPQQLHAISSHHSLPGSHLGTQAQFAKLR